MDVIGRAQKGAVKFSNSLEEIQNQDLLVQTVKIVAGFWPLQRAKGSHATKKMIPIQRPNPGNFASKTGLSIKISQVRLQDSLLRPYKGLRHADKS